MNDVISSWLGQETGHNALGAGNNALAIGNNLISIRWGLTLLHFLWQGAIIGLLALVAARLLRNHSASVRYWLNAAALLACPICVAWTFATVEVPETWQASSDQHSHESRNSIAFPMEASDANSLVNVPYPKLDPPQTIPSADAAAVPLDASAEPLATTPVAIEIKTSTTSEWMPIIARWISILYAVGVACFLFRLAIALWGGHRLRAISTPVSDSALLDLIRTQAHRIGLKLVPVVAYCERVAVPTVIGVLRPMILLPATLTSGLTTEELSAILSHELAHIRRYDLWMNLLQRIIESLLFFHPVVWFLSRRLSAEREICCDDLVVRSGCPPMIYAGALLRMAEVCHSLRKTNVANLAASGDEPTLLEHRMARLLNAAEMPRLQLTRVGVLALIMLTLISAVALPGLFRSWAQAEEASASNDGNTANDQQSQKSSKPVNPVGNKTVRQRDLMQHSSDPNVDPRVGPDAIVKIPAQNPPAPPVAAKDDIGPKVTVRRRIVNGIDGSPIAGAKVSIQQIEREYLGGEESGFGIWWDIKQIRDISKAMLISDANGYVDYETSTTIRQNTETVVTFNVSHEKYVPVRSMIQLSFIRDHNPLPDSLNTIKLWHSQVVRGTVLNPDGSPAVNIPIHGSTLLESDTAAPRKQIQQLYDLSTDGQGNFQLPVASPGAGLFWIVSDQYAPQSIVVSSTNPNVGVLRLEEGKRIKGIILDANGAPVAGTDITARPLSSVDSDVMDFLKKTRGRIQGAYRREVESDADGRFVLPPVHEGKYEITVADRVSHVENDVTVVNPASYVGVFIRQNLDVVSDPQEIVLKAVPSVDVQFKTVDSAGHPVDGMEFLLSDRISDSPKSDSTTLSFAAMSKYTTKGITVVRVPAELIDPQIRIRGYSADGGCAFVIHPALKQVSSVQPIPSVPMYQATFATVEDIAELQVTRFEATTLIVKVVDEQNQPVTKAAPKIEIESPEENLGNSTMSFVKESDGHWICTRLIPKIELTVSVEAAGLQSDKQVVTLKEGEKRQITIQMKKGHSLPKEQEKVSPAAEKSNASNETPSEKTATPNAPAPETKTSADQKPPAAEKAANRYRVLSADGEPVSNAVVRLIYQKEDFRELIVHSVKYETKTDADGYFQYPKQLKVPFQVANEQDSGGHSATWITIPANEKEPEQTWLLGSSAGVRFPYFEAIAAMMRDPKKASSFSETPAGDNTKSSELPNEFRLPKFETTIRVVNADGSPAAGVQVNPSQIAWARMEGGSKNIFVPDIIRDSLSRTTDANGRVTFVTIERMEFAEIEFRSERHGLQRTFTNMNTIGPELEHDIVLFPAGKVSGTIKADTAEQKEFLRTNKLLLQTQVINLGLPAPNGFRIALEGIAEVTPDEQGRFEIPAMLAGQMFLRDRLPDNSLHRITFKPRQITKSSEESLIEGQVISAVKIQGIAQKRDSKEGVAGIPISIRHGGRQSGLSRELTVYARTDADGHFEVHVFPGRVGYSSLTVPDSYAQAWSWDLDYDANQEWLYGQRVVVPDDTSNFELPPLEFVHTKEILGKLVDADGNPVAKTGVYARARANQNGNDFATTDNNGEFALKSFAEGYFPEAVQVGEQFKLRPARLISRDPLILQDSQQVPK